MERRSGANAMKSFTLLTLLFTSALLCQKSDLSSGMKKSLPGWVKQEFSLGYYDRQFEISTKLYPEFLRGDFNGDKKYDYAVQVRERKSGKLGIIFFQGRRTQSHPGDAFIVGAGRNMGKAADSFLWADVWSRFDKLAAYSEINSPQMPTFEGDVIKLYTRDGRSGFIYWDGIKYCWHEVTGK